VHEIPVEGGAPGWVEAMHVPVENTTLPVEFVTLKDTPDEASRDAVMHRMAPTSALVET
jgi:hypothetical protein